MKFKYTILYVESVKDTLKFFADAFGLKQSMIHESGDYGELDTGATTLSFSSRKLMTDMGKNPVKPNPSAPTFEIAFETDDVAAALERSIKAGATLMQDVAHMPWGQTTAYIADRNGFFIEICTPINSQS